MKQAFDFVNSEIKPGLTVIESSAGTGKTYAISHLVPRLLLDDKSPVAHLSEILIVTFTNDAAKELSDRVRKVLEKLYAPAVTNEEECDYGIFQLRQSYPDKKHIISQALLDMDRMGISTIHSFCQRTIQTEGTLCGLPVIPQLIPNADEIIEQALYDLWKDQISLNELAAAIVSVKKMTLEADVQFVKFALPLHDATSIPQPRCWDVAIQDLEQFPKKFTDQVCDEILGIFQRVAVWTEKAPGAKQREFLLKTLRDAQSAAHPGFLDAARMLAFAKDWINGQGKIRTALKREIASSRGLEIARELFSLVDGLAWDWQNWCLEVARAKVASTLHANRQITYDGLIETLYRAINGTNSQALVQRLRNRYQVALIDESQDTDTRQFEIFRKIFVGLNGETPLPTHSLVLIGDPKQAIYSFRGADVNTYLEARDLAGSQVFQLNQTFRAPTPLVQASNALFLRPDTFLKKELSFTEASSGMTSDWTLQKEGSSSEGRIEFWIAPDGPGNDYSNKEKRNAFIADTVASEIVRILNSQGSIQRTELGASMPEGKLVEPGDFAVLVSDHYQADAMSDALKRRSVPGIRAGGDDIMASDEAAELLTVLRALLNPRRSGLRFAALATRLLGFNDIAIQEIRDSTEKDERILEKFLGWQNTLLHQGISPTLAQIDHELTEIHEGGITLRLAATDRGERYITNLRQLTDLLQAASLELGNHSGHILRWFTQEIARAGERSDVEERQLQLESDEDAVQIVTMHASKGLEYSLVFCPFLWISRDLRSVEKLAITKKTTCFVNTELAGNQDIKIQLARNALEDRLRLAYVAITRAKVRVWIYGGEICASRNRPQASALDWLLRTNDAIFSDQWCHMVSGAGRGARHTAGIDALIAKSQTENLIIRRDPPLATDECWRHSTGRHHPHLTRRSAPHVPEPWVMTSFSSLTREKHQQSDGTVILPETAVLEPGANPFCFAPGGALVGTAIHAWIEQWDFARLDAMSIKTHLKKYGLPTANAEGFPPMHTCVTSMLEELRTAILPGFQCHISEACRTPEASEWHFQIPIHHSLSAYALADIFAAHGESEYAAMLRILPTDQLKGYLHGFLDRLAVHQDIWGVIDWKTNKLVEGYGQLSLKTCAMQNHYLLQTYLYLVALRRFLGPDVPIAGAWLVFLRGIHSFSSDGILHIQPSEALMKDLDGLFTQPSICTH